MSVLRSWTHTQEIVEIEEMKKSKSVKEEITMMDYIDLEKEINAQLVGQSDFAKAIVPALHATFMGLMPERRPASTTMLLGPTGVGKTHAVEVLAEVLHGRRESLLRINCGEFQQPHEIAKLIGAPPGYLGHRETQAIFSQARVNAVTSERCGVPIILFDEIEKADDALIRILLGVLDIGELRTGDGNTVRFQGSLIFMTSNVGANETTKELAGGYGFIRDKPNLGRIRSISSGALRRRFSPEFLNRIDNFVTFGSLSSQNVEHILLIELNRFKMLIQKRLGLRYFSIEVSDCLLQHVLELGVSAEFGARELKRILNRFVAQPTAAYAWKNRPAPGSTLRLDLVNGIVTINEQRIDDPVEADIMSVPLKLRTKSAP